MTSSPLPPSSSTAATPSSDKGTAPKVSVLMLAYNQERYIGEAIRSVMLQETDFDYELVIGDDASTDGTSRICREWQERYPDRIVLPARPRNLGLQQNFLQTYACCRGRYVAICEGDDYWCDRRKLQLQADFLDRHPDYSTCFHRVVNYFEDRGTKSLSNGGQRETTDILDLARSNYISNVSALFRRNLFGPLPDWFARVSTYDYALHLLNAEHGKLYYMRRPMAVYRQHSHAIWSEAGADRKWDIALTVRELLIDHFRDRRPDVCDCLREAHTRICLSLMAYYRQRGDAPSAAQAEARLLAQRPGWTAADILRLEQTSRPGTMQRLKASLLKVLKWGRATVSRVVPLPRI